MAERKNLKIQKNGNVDNKIRSAKLAGRIKAWEAAVKDYEDGWEHAYEFIHKPKPSEFGIKSGELRGYELMQKAQKQGKSIKKGIDVTPKKK